MCCQWAGSVTGLALVVLRRRLVMANHFDVLGISPTAKQEEIQVAFDQLLAARRAKRQRTGDLYQAISVVGDPVLRKAYTAVLLTESAGDKLVHARAVTLEFARDNLPDVDLKEVSRHAWQTFLRTTVLVTGATAKASEVTGAVSRRVQQEAARRIVS